MLSVSNRINSKKDLKEWLNYEKILYTGSGKGRVIRTLLPISEMDILRKHQIILRKTEYYTNSGNKLMSFLYRIILMRMQNKYSLHIPLNTCGKGLKIMHLGPVLINGRATIGKDCSIHINTAIVAGGADDETPVIGDKVVIGVGAVLLGGIRIFDNSTIGANAVVNKTLAESNVTIAGVPAKILKKKQNEI